jgi:phospholipase A1/A2
MTRFFALFLLIFNVKNPPLSSQSISKDSVRFLVKQSSPFSIFRDNFFIVGTTPDQKPDDMNSNIKFQFSIKQRLTNAVLPFQTYLYFTYSQKSIWRCFQESSPFAESNYNPTLGLGKAIFYKNKFVGIGGITFDHESNGRDGAASRSWNRVIGHYATALSRSTTVGVHAWIPFADKVDNPDIVKYLGYGNVEIMFTSPNQRWVVDGQLHWRAVELQAGFRLSKKSNQYLGIQWFRGYAETLIVYNNPIQMIRLGLLIKPPRFQVF